MMWCIVISAPRARRSGLRKSRSRAASQPIDGMAFEHLFQKGVLVEVVTVDVHPQLTLARAHDLAQPGGREASLDPPVGPPIDAGGPVFGCLGCGGCGHDCS